MHTKSKQPAFLAVFFASLLWLAVWSVTHGLFMSDMLIRLFPGGWNTRYLLATAYIGIVTVLALILFKKYRTQVMPKSKMILLYVLPLAILLALPFHYNLFLLLPVFIAMTLITCFWQDFLTFGLFQTYVSTKVGKWLEIIIVTVVFFIGHLVFYLDSLLTMPIAGWGLILVASFVLAALRRYTGTIYAGNVLHLSFLLLAG